MKRYDVTTEYNNGVMEEDPDGDYVKISDVIIALDTIATDMIDEAIALQELLEELRR